MFFNVHTYLGRLAGNHQLENFGDNIFLNRKHKSWVFKGTSPEKTSLSMIPK